MIEREKAPGWVIPGMLLLSLISAVIGLLIYLDILHLNLVEYTSEYGDYSAFSYLPFWWLLSALPILFYGWIAIASINKRWRKAVTIGSLIKVGCEIIGVIILLLELSTNNRYELSSLFDFVFPINRITDFLTVAGILLVVWNTKATVTMKVSITVYEILCIIVRYLWIYFQNADINTYLTIVNPLLVVALFVIYYYNRKSDNRSII